MSTLLLTGGRVIDPANKRDKTADVYIKDGRVAEIDPGLASKLNDTLSPEQVIDCSGHLVCPGFIDLAPRFHDIDSDQRESLRTLCQAATAGGYTHILPHPGTHHPIDTPRAVQSLITEAHLIGLCRVTPLAKLKRQDGLADLYSLREAGVAAFYADSRELTNKQTYNALRLLADISTPLIVQPFDPELGGEGVCALDHMSDYLGLPGSPAEAESIEVRRLRTLAGAYGPLHFHHISTSHSLAALSEHPFDNLTADVSAIHFTSECEVIEGLDPRNRIFPPIRDEDHWYALRTRIRQGEITAVSSGHCPRTLEEKQREFELALPGCDTLEDIIGSIFHFANEDHLHNVVAAFTSGPARRFGLPDAGTLSIGAAADVTVIDTDAPVGKPRQARYTRGRLPYFDGPGFARPAYTIINGRVAASHGKLINEDEPHA